MNPMDLQPDALQCTFEDAERNHLLDGIAMSTEAKVAFFEEMLVIAQASGALQRELDRRAKDQFELWIAHEPDSVRRQYGR